MKPFLTNANPTLLETMPSFMTPFAKIFTTKEQLTIVGIVGVIIWLSFNKNRSGNSRIKNEFYLIIMYQ